jgi:hypothetical protein
VRDSCDKNVNLESRKLESEIYLEIKQVSETYFKFPNLNDRQGSVQVSIALKYSKNGSSKLADPNHFLILKLKLAKGFTSHDSWNINTSQKFVRIRTPFARP